MFLNTPLIHKLTIYYYNTDTWKTQVIIEAVVQRCSVRKVFLEILQNSQENTSARVSFLIKETLALVFCCEFCEISKDIFFW